MKLSLVFFRRLAFFGLLLIQSIVLSAQSAFTVIPLGVRGGLDESNLSAYLVGPVGGADYVCMDAGTLYAGLAKAVASGLFTQAPGAVLRSHVKGYFISHPHLDHVAGLIINSPDDTAKNIYGLPACLATLQEKYFSWKSWANFGDEGEKPQLKKYHYVTMEPGREIPADNTPLFVQAFPLSHGKPFESTAFLIRSGSQYLLYLGDTGADSVEGSDRLHTLWTAVAPLVKSGALRAIFIEVSFPNEQPVKSLFGHLTPALLQQEMRVLTSLTAGEDPAKPGGPSASTAANASADAPAANALTQVAIVITHRKPVGNQEEAIKRQLKADNPLHLKLVFPEQGRRLNF